MGLGLDIKTAVAKIFRENWDPRDGTVVPSDSSVTLGNDAVKLSATVLYADLAESTSLVDVYPPHFAAEIYKTYLSTAGRIIRDEGGTITAYDGDRIMAVFIGDRKNTRAVKTALKINYAVKSLIMPAKRAQYPDNTYELKQVVGIDTSEMWVAKTGVRGANDLVWVGRAANHAAKLTALPDAHSSYITAAVYGVLSDEAKTSSSGKTMWERVRWTGFNNSIIYRSNWTWRIGD
jgi:class 3 adenylate cyclase